MNSTHGTFVNGQKVAQHRLQPGDRIHLGRDEVEFVFFSGEPIESEHASEVTSRDPQKSVMQLTSAIHFPEPESSDLEKISHILDFQYSWEQSFSPENMFRQILDSALQLSGAERGYVLLREENEFNYVIGMNSSGELLSQSEFKTSHSVIQDVATGGKPVLMTQGIDQEFARQQSILALDLRAVACMPLKWISSESEQPEVRGILYLDSRKTMHALSGLDQKILNKLADEAAGIFEKLELIKAVEDRKAIERELALATETQQALLPLQLPEVRGYELAAFSRATRYVGGDFYDFFRLSSSNFSGVLADVSGKGISAALLSSLLQGALEMESRSGTSLDKMLNQINVYLCEKSKSNRFVTLFLFNLDSEGNGEYLSAGHNPAYLYRARTRRIEELKAEDMVLGAFSFASYHSIAFQMTPGDLLVVYSDGITEAMNPQDEMYGEERLIHLIGEYASCGAQKLKETLLRSIEQFTEGMPQTDDITCVLVQKEPELSRSETP
jgi:serine phosphatase RsbU (regulator of sigma subunit)